MGVVGPKPPKGRRRKSNPLEIWGKLKTFDNCPAESARFFCPGKSRASQRDGGELTPDFSEITSQRAGKVVWESQYPRVQTAFNGGYRDGTGGGL